MAVFPAADSQSPEVDPGSLKARVLSLFGMLGGRRDQGGHEKARQMALVAFFIRVVSAAIAFASQVILARIMGEREYGIFVFVWVLVIIVGNLSCFGLHAAQIRFLPHYQLSGQISRIRGMTTTVRIMAFGIATALSLAGWVGLSMAGGYVPIYYQVPLFVALLILPMVALGDVMEGTARAHSWGIAALSPSYIIRPLLILGFMLAAVWWGAPATAETALKMCLCATYATTIGQLFNIRWRLGRQHRSGPRSFEVKAWLTMAFPLFLIEGFGFLLTNSDVIVVGFFLEPDKVAIYFAAAKTMSIVQFVYFSVKAASAPRFSALLADNDRDGLARFAGETVRWVFWPGLVVGLLILAAGPWLLAMFGPAFSGGLPLMAILFAGIMAKASVGPGEVLLAMAGHQKLCAALYAGALIINISLNVTLIPLLGLPGAAMAAAGAMVAEAILLHIFVRQRLGITLFAFADPAPRSNPAKAESHG